MERITSASNKGIRELSQLQQKSRFRRESGLFVTEGIRLFLDTPVSAIRKVFVAESLAEKAGLLTKSEGENGGGDPYNEALRRKVLDLDGSVPVCIVRDDVLQKASDTVHPQGILAEAAVPVWEKKDLLAKKPGFLVLLEDVQDPGNIGTIFRTAEAAGAGGVILSAGCADITQPKVVRSTMSAVFRVPFYYTESMTETVRELRQGTFAEGGEAFRVFAAHLKGSVPYDSPDYLGASALIIGNEGRGISEETAKAAGDRIRIPMDGLAESLNAAVSAGILMYEVRRQRTRGADA